MTKILYPEHSSFSESTDHGIDEEISATFARLQSRLDLNDPLRKTLDALLCEREAEAKARVRKAQLYLELVTEEATKMREILKGNSDVKPKGLFYDMSARSEEETRHICSTEMSEAQRLSRELYEEAIESQREQPQYERALGPTHGFNQFWDNDAHATGIAEGHHRLHLPEDDHEEEIAEEEYLREMALLVAAEEQRAEEEQQAIVEQWQRECLEDLRIEEERYRREKMQNAAAEVDVSRGAWDPAYAYPTMSFTFF